MTRLLHFTFLDPDDLSSQIAALEGWHRAHAEPVFALCHYRDAQAFGTLPDWLRLTELRFARRFGQAGAPFTALADAIRRELPDVSDRVLLTDPDLVLADPAILGKLVGAAPDTVFVVADKHQDIAGASRRFPAVCFDAGMADTLNLPDSEVGIGWGTALLPLAAMASGHRVRRLDGTGLQCRDTPPALAPAVLDQAIWDALRHYFPRAAGGASRDTETLRGFLGATEGFLSGPAVDVGPGETAAGVWERYTAAVAEAVGTEMVRAPVPGPRPAPPRPVSVPPIAAAPTRTRYRLLIAVRSKDGDAERVKTRFQSAIDREGLAQDLGLEICELHEAEIALSADDGCFALFLYPDPGTMLERKTDAPIDLPQHLKKWRGLADQVLKAQSRHRSRSAIASLRAAMQNPAAVFAATCHRVAIPLDLPPLQQEASEDTPPQTANRLITGLVVRGQGGAGERLERLEALSVLPQPGPSHAPAEAARWLLDHLATSRKIRQALEDRSAEILGRNENLQRELEELRAPHPALQLPRRLLRGGLRGLRNTYRLLPAGLRSSILGARRKLSQVLRRIVPERMRRLLPAGVRRRLLRVLGR